MKPVVALLALSAALALGCERKPSTPPKPNLGGAPGAGLLASGAHP